MRYPYPYRNWIPAFAGMTIVSLRDAFLFAGKMPATR